MGKAPRRQFDIRASFGVAFKNWREKNHLSLKEIAAELGVSIATIHAWESAKRFPSGDNLEILSNYMNTPPCRLFCVLADKCVPAECLRAQSKPPKTCQER